MVKRAFDIFFSALGLVLLTPLLLLIGLAIALRDPGPVIFRQLRVGRYGEPFWILKYRTMVVNAEQLGASITRAGDSRITPIGRLLRKTKFDELPQLLNVLVGDMSFVGPRPEVPRYVEKYTPEQRQVLNLRPGITDLATLEFRNEEELLNSAADSETFYVDYCIPRKIDLNLAYAAGANVWEDTKIILRTIFPRLHLRSHVERNSTGARSPGFV